MAHVTEPESSDEEVDGRQEKGSLVVGAVVRIGEGKKKVEGVIRKLSEEYVHLLTSAGEKVKVLREMDIDVLESTGPLLLWHKGHEEDTLFKDAKILPTLKTETPRLGTTPAVKTRTPNP